LRKTPLGVAGSTSNINTNDLIGQLSTYIIVGVIAVIIAVAVVATIATPNAIGAQDWHQ
jgi:hypothetical protein